MFAKWNFLPLTSSKGQVISSWKTLRWTLQQTNYWNKSEREQLSLVYISLKGRVFGLFCMLVHTSLFYSFSLPKNAWFENTTNCSYLLVDNKVSSVLFSFKQKCLMPGKISFFFFPLPDTTCLLPSFSMKSLQCSHPAHCLWALCCLLYNQDLVSMTVLRSTILASSQWTLVEWVSCFDLQLQTGNYG